MASKFMSDIPLAGMEAQMQQVPGFKPRKCGMSVSRLELTQARGGCSGKAEGQGNCGPPGGTSPGRGPGGGAARKRSLCKSAGPLGPGKETHGCA